MTEVVKAAVAVDGAVALDGAVAVDGAAGRGGLRRVAFVAVLVVLFVVNLAWPTDRPEATHSSFGTIPEGHRAIFELLMARGEAGGRSVEGALRMTPGGVLWIVEPDGVCDGRIALGGDVDVLDAAAVVWPGAEWVAGGGTAVIYLEPDGEERARCDAVAGVPLPERVTLGSVASQDENLESSDADAPPPPLLAEIVAQTDSDVPSRARALGVTALRVFDGTLDWRASAAARVGDVLHPFALERSHGAGRLVVVADAGFLRNRWLREGDAAPLAVDFVRVYGAPRFDERAHGFLPETNALRYLARSVAAPVFAGLALVGLLVVWRGAALPARRVEEIDPEAPTLESFVDSLAHLYAGTRDYARVGERYRASAADRLRRHFGLPPGVSVTALSERALRDPRITPDAVRCLTRSTEIRSAGELRAVARELDALVLAATSLAPPTS